MAIAPISAMKVNGGKNGIVSFQSRNNEEKHPQYNDSKSHNLAKIPVIVMIAMTPSMLNAKTPEQFVPLDVANATELYSPLIAQNDATYVALKPQEFQQVEPLGVAYFNDKKVQQIVKGKISTENVKIVLTGSEFDKLENQVNNVYFIRDSYKNDNRVQRPPRILGLIYHNLGPDKEFLGVEVEQNLYKDVNARIPNAIIRREYRLDDESAQFLLDFHAGETKWVNKTGIIFAENKKPNTAPVNVIKDKD